MRVLNPSIFLNRLSPRAIPLHDRSPVYSINSRIHRNSSHKRGRKNICHNVYANTKVLFYCRKLLEIVSPRISSHFVLSKEQCQPHSKSLCSPCMSQTTESRKEVVLIETFIYRLTEPRKKACRVRLKKEECTNILLLKRPCFSCKYTVI